MAVGALIPLLFGGALLKDKLDRNRSEDERLKRVSAFNEGIGTSADGSNLFNSGQMQTLDQVTPGSGILGTIQDPRIRAQVEAAQGMFGTLGGQEQGQSMLRDALSFQDAGRRQESLFNQQDQQQENQFDNTNQNAEANREQQDRHHLERIQEQRNIAADQLERASIQNSVNGIPAGDKNRVGLPGGGFVDVPKQGTVQYETAAAEISGMEGMVTTLDDMTELFKDTGSFTVGEKSGRLSTLYAAAKLNMKEVFKLGVLSESDEKLIEELIQDPQSIGGQLTSNKSMQAGYEEAMTMLQRSLRTANQQYSLWGLGSELDNATPSQIRAQQTQAKIDKAAADAGLTPGRAPGSGVLQNRQNDLQQITRDRFDIIDQAGRR